MRRFDRPDLSGWPSLAFETWVSPSRSLYRAPRSQKRHLGHRLKIVIPTGRVMGFGPTQGDEKRLLFSNYSHWKDRPPLCYLDRSVAQWRDLRFSGPFLGMFSTERRVVDLRLGAATQYFPNSAMARKRSSGWGRIASSRIG